MAQRDEWEALVALEMEYLTAVSSTAKLMSQANPTPTQQEDLRQVLKQILLNETHVKQRLQARMDELRQLIGNGSRQQALSMPMGSSPARSCCPASTYNHTPNITASG
uniref:Flagellar protein FliT n=1 Tax=Edwardsiella tarda TaxID=636 RepID=Q4ACK9_EDWTA|nr:repressor [Edwardsiella tarda]